MTPWPHRLCILALLRKIVEAGSSPQKFTTLVMAKAYKVQAIIHTRERSGATHTQRLINRTNHTISPLFRLDAEGTLSMSKQMAKRLDIAKIGHVGKNIRILSTDEQ